MVWVFIIAILLCFAIWNREKLLEKYRLRKKKLQREKSFQYEYRCGNDKMVAVGNRDKFTIIQNDKLTFQVVDGQIISVSDGKKTYMYGVD